jgi:hypothetical protein
MPEVTATSEDERAAGGDANPVEGAVRAVDRFQQRHVALAFPFAVVKKFGDDGAGSSQRRSPTARSWRCFPCCCS